MNAPRDAIRSEAVSGTSWLTSAHRFATAEPRRELILAALSQSGASGSRALRKSSHTRGRFRLTGFRRVPSRSQPMLDETPFRARLAPPRRVSSTGSIAFGFSRPKLASARLTGSRIRGVGCAEPLGPAPARSGPVRPSWEQLAHSLNPVRDLSPGDRPGDWIDEGTEMTEPHGEAVESPADSTDASGAAPAPARSVNPLAPPQRYQVQFTVSDEYVDLVERAKALLSHVVPNVRLEDLHLRAMRALVAELEKRRHAGGHVGRRAPGATPREAPPETDCDPRQRGRVARGDARGARGRGPGSRIRAVYEIHPAARSRAPSRGILRDVGIVERCLGSDIRSSRRARAAWLCLWTGSRAERTPSRLPYGRGLSRRAALREQPACGAPPERPHAAPLPHLHNRRRLYFGTDLQTGKCPAGWERVPRRSVDVSGFLRSDRLCPRRGVPGRRVRSSDLRRARCTRVPRTLVVRPRELEGAVRRPERGDVRQLRLGTVRRRRAGLHRDWLHPQSVRRRRRVHVW